jgi:hypothetical protein
MLSSQLSPPTPISPRQVQCSKRGGRIRLLERARQDLTGYGFVPGDFTAGGVDGRKCLGGEGVGVVFARDGQGLGRAGGLDSSGCLGRLVACLGSWWISALEWSLERRIRCSILALGQFIATIYIGGYS